MISCSGSEPTQTVTEEPATTESENERSSGAKKLKDDSKYRITETPKAAESERGQQEKVSPANDEKTIDHKGKNQEKIDSVKKAKNELKKMKVGR
ncbi:MAG: hypothetical protein IH946_05615 [Bacteroidetes bacterium]|nr:hypothetical protein [Bacteroidota bacterium]